MSKSEIFTKEISYIKDESYKENIKKLIELLPDYFFEVAASSTGKYHPKYALGDGGLVRHTKAAVRIAHELLENKSVSGNFNEREKDLMIMALIMHDGFKHGLKKSTYTVFDHPLVVANFIKDNKDKLTLNDEDINFIAEVISSHMGEWNTNPYSDVILPIPKNRYQKFVHMCDFLASKKFINMDFVGNDIVD